MEDIPVVPRATALPSAAGYEALYGRAPALVALLDAAGLVRYASPAYAAILGTAPAALPGSAFLEPIHPDDREAVRGALTAVVARPEAEAVVTYRCRHADGSWRSIAATLSNGLDDPLLAGLVLAGSDVTPQREAQAQAEVATQRLKALQTVTDTVLAHLGLDDLMRQVLDRVTEVLDVDNTAILLLDESGQELRLHLARGPGGGAGRPGARPGGSGRGRPHRADPGAADHRRHGPGRPS